MCKMRHKLVLWEILVDHAWSRPTEHRYIEDEPHFMDSDSESETEDNNWQMQENKEN